MVKKYPPTIEECKRRREKVPVSELKFFNLVDALDDNWHVWHSIKWDNDTKMRSGEADFLIFNPNLGFVVVEVKGGIISIENNTFYSTATNTRQKFHLDKSPFNQAENSMHHIVRFYVERAKKEPNSKELLKSSYKFPLNFSYAVFFPDCNFKDDFEYLQYDFNKIFDESDLNEHRLWQEQSQNQTSPSPLEEFLVNLLDQYKYLRMEKPKIAEFFPKLIGSNISKYLNLKKYYDIREKELTQVNQVQDFLLDALSEKKHCIFKGSAGSGKTFIAMKKALRCYEEDKDVLFLCFNVELREFIKSHLGKCIGKPYGKIMGKISVFSIMQFLKKLIEVMFDSDTTRKLLSELSNFSYLSIAEAIRNNKEKIPISFTYDVILIDEAQDIDSNLWDLFISFLKEPTSLFYVFYDEAQALFVEDFAPTKFGMDEHSDLILLNRNLRNTIEIAKWLTHKTTYGDYKEYSGINGFKITSHKFSSGKEAIIKAVNVIRNKYYTQGIELERIIILSYFKLKTIFPYAKNNSYCDFLMFKGKIGMSGMNAFVVEPHSIATMPQIKCHKDINNELCIAFKTISAFKGLESDIIFLIVPNLNDFKEKYPERYDNFLMQLYVGISRAKFKLYFLEYKF